MLNIEPEIGQFLDGSLRVLADTKNIAYYETIWWELGINEESVEIGRFS